MGRLSSTHNNGTSTTTIPILFVSPTIITGEEGALPYVSDVLVSNGIVTEIAPQIAIDRIPPRTQRIDASGLFLTPGFIDMHAHSDLYLLSHPAHEPKISQGCTTEVVGQDGISYAPVRTKVHMKAIRDQIAGWNGNPTDEECAARGRLEGVGMFEWDSIKGYLDCLDRNKTATNVAMLVPQGNLRLLACGPYDTPATPEEIQDQVALLRQAMEEGAVGMSSGLTYTPGMYASTSELAVLCKILADEFPGAFYAPHHRSYGMGAIEAYGEMLQLSKETSCPVHLTHATLNFAENQGRAPQLISMINSTRSAGADVTLDTYPYLPGCTTLASLLPSWVSSGGPVDTLRRLEDLTMREKIRVAVEVDGCDGGHGIPTDWDTMQLGTCTHPELLGYSGRRIGEVARSIGVLPIAVFFDVLIKDNLSTSCIMHIGNEENVREIMCHPTHCSGSDAILHGSQLHPRAYGTFPRFLGHYARDEKLMSIPEMVPHLTSRPAKRLGIYPRRGIIAMGSAADIVLFDPETIKDMSTYDRPRAKAQGIRWVLVNGHVAMEDGKLTGTRGGRTLRRRNDGKVGEMSGLALEQGPSAAREMGSATKAKGCGVDGNLVDIKVVSRDLGGGLHMNRTVKTVKGH